MDAPRDLDPDSIIRCEPVRCTMRLRWCLERHTKRTASGGGRGSADLPECASCQHGAAFLRRCPFFVAHRPTMAPVVLPPPQRAARRWLMLTTLEPPEQPGLGPIAEAAMLCPDDGGFAVEGAALA